MKGTGKRIRQCRLSCGMTQEDVARHLGIAKQTVYKYEADIVTNIPLIHLERMGKLFRVPPGYLAGWIDAESLSDPVQPDEKQLLEIFRALPEKGKEFLLQQARASEILYGDDLDTPASLPRLRLAEDPRQHGPTDETV